MRILGIGLSHCAGIALIEDGCLVFAQEEDRFSRRRRHKGWPDLSLSYLLDKYGLLESDIDLCVLCDVQTAKRIPHQINAKRVISVHHHLAHVLSGWALSSWDDFDAISLDGGGDFGSWQSFARVRGRKIENWESNCGSYLSKGTTVSRKWLRRATGRSFGAYWSVPAVMNFGMIDKYGVGGYEGKLMGLAGHGDQNAFDRRLANYDAKFSVKSGSNWNWLKTEGYPKIGDNHYVITPTKEKYSLSEVRRLRKEKQEIVFEYDLKTQTDLEFAANFAAYLQEMTNSSIQELFKNNFSRDVPVVVSGGTFGNVVLNGALNQGYEVFVTPPMGDEGLALGAAAWGAYCTGIEQIRVENYYLGFNAGGNPDVDVDEVARLLNEDKIVALVEGGMELGPRALGARSILASPRDSAANFSINNRLDRVEYMPFAPVILEEYADDVLIGWSRRHQSSAHMTLVYQVKPEWRDQLKGVVHVDGSVRPQVLSRSINPVYYDIVDAYFRLTGIPALINTSFNIHGEPIIRTIEEAKGALASGRIDALVAGNKLHLHS